MRYTVRRSVVRIIGGIWWPMGGVCAMDKDLSAYDIENIRDEDGMITRDGIENWLGMNAGDFSSVHDFEASIEDGEKSLDFHWAKGEDSEVTYCDAMYPTESE